MPSKRPDKLHVLIVDDSILNLEITSDFIEDLGFSLDTACNGVQALEAFKQQSYALICMDIHMPVMDGLEASRSIRQFEIEHGLAPVPIIALTSDSTDGIRKRCCQAGMNDYLEKPFTQQEIFRKISLWIDEEHINNSQASATISPTLTDKDGKQILDAVENISQVSHWIWHINENRLQFSTYLQHYFNFPLDDIDNLDDFIEHTDCIGMRTVINECIATRHETRYEQKPDTDTPDSSEYILHRFRVVTCEDDKPVLIGTVQDISSVRRSEQHMMELASYDAITGLSSRLRFNQQLEDLITASQRHLKKFIVLHIKLNPPREVCDNSNTSVYNRMLIDVANRLRSILRKSDFACRLLDDEFCLTINEITDELSAIKIAERCLTLLSSPINIDSRQISLNAGIGMAVHPDDGSSATQLINRAKKASDRAHSDTDSAFTFFSKEMCASARYRIHRESEIRTALDERQFELYYQPKISLNNGEVCSVEAFIRWNHPDKTLHSPDTFLAETERMGLIIELGNWVIQNACDQLTIWQEQGMRSIPISINISQKHFELPDFSEQLLVIVNKAGVAPSLIQIEIAESISRNQDTFTTTCQKLRSYGFSTAIDNFGAGYSSLSKLIDIPIDILKIDKEFIDNLPDDTQSSIIVGTILGISNALGVRVVAEGVENEQQLKTLVAMGCHTAQGFYFSEAVPASEIPDLCARNFRPCQTINLVA